MLNKGIPYVKWLAALPLKHLHWYLVTSILQIGSIVYQHSINHKQICTLSKQTYMLCYIRSIIFQIVFTNGCIKNNHSSALENFTLIQRRHYFRRRTSHVVLIKITWRLCAWRAFKLLCHTCCDTARSSVFVVLSPKPLYFQCY